MLADDVSFKMTEMEAKMIQNEFLFELIFNLSSVEY